jgi:hypothetical protein
LNWSLRLLIFATSVQARLMFKVPCDAGGASGALAVAVADGVVEAAGGVLALEQAATEAATRAPRTVSREALKWLIFVSR